MNAADKPHDRPQDRPEEPRAGSTAHPDNLDAALAPPERRARFSQNRSMLAVVVVVAVCLAVVVIALLLG